MNEIKCPKCNQFFKVDESGFADIAKQVRDKEFEKELREREALMERERENAVKLAEAKTKNEIQESVAKRDAEIAELKAKIDTFEASKNLAIAEAMTEMVKERDALAFELKNKETEKQLAVTKAVAMEAQKVAETVKERDDLKIQFANKETETQSMKNRYEEMLKYKDDEIERIKNMKIELSTKGIGESLEQFCQNEFNKIRAAAFPNSFFDKDNDASGGTKGDFVFRHPATGVESISIMFEMKNESEETVKKQKNESFFAKLDKDRQAKKCEYAILVSTLEADSDLYNQGIVDVSHIYPKMYVIRPQFFIPMITLLKNAADKSFAIKNELAVIRNQDVDITTFEDDVNNWKNNFLVTIKNAGKKHEEAIGQIDKAINDLIKARDALTMSDKHLITAENKMDDLTIKRLTRKNPTMAAKFAELKEQP